MLVGIGALSLFSLREVSSFPFLERQLIWTGVGLIFLGGASLIDFRLFRTQSYAVLFFYLVTLLLLLFVAIADFKIRGVSAWVKIGNIFVQPVEPAKLVLVILLAKFFSRRHIEIYRIQHLVVSGIYVVVPALLVLLQPDLGSALVLVAIWVAVVVFSGMKLRHFIALILLMALAGFAAWGFLLAPYQKARLSTFLNPYSDPRGVGYQMIQSMIAVGSGQLWGKGLGYGSQSHLNFLPEAHTDFIFAAFAEEWGLAGVTALLFLFAVFLWRVIVIGMRSSDNFSRLYTLGFASLIFTQVFVHIGMNVGVLPITGLPLPFISYGGSSLVTLLIGVGILQNIKINSRREIE